MPKSITITEATRHFSGLIDRVRFYGERVILTKGGKPVAELGPTPLSDRVRLAELPGILAELPHLDPEDAAHFADDLKAARLTLTLPTDPWALSSTQAS